MRITLVQNIIDLLRFKKTFTRLKLLKLKHSNRYKYTHKIFPNLGKNSYIGLNSQIILPETKIGKFCSISWNVMIGTSFHPLHYLSTHPFAYCKSRKETVLYHEMSPDKIKLVDFVSCKPCTIGNDVWIGCQSIIMDGVKIGDGAIIGANSTITKDVPPYAIVVGANRIVGYRFSQDIINDLLELKWWDLDEKYLYDLPFDDINACIEKLKEIRKKVPVISMD